MATRLYFSGLAAEVSPAYSLAYADTTQASRNMLRPFKDGSVRVQKNTSLWGTATLYWQLVSKPLAAGSVFTGASDGLTVFLFGLAPMANDATCGLRVEVYDNTGTTLRMMIYGGVVGGYIPSGTPTSFRADNGSKLGSSYTTVTGDRLVVSISFAGASSGDANIRLDMCSQGADYGNGETVQGKSGWIEFGNDFIVLDSQPGGTFATQMMANLGSGFGNMNMG